MSRLVSSQALTIEQESNERRKRQRERGGRGGKKGGKEKALSVPFEIFHGDYNTRASPVRGKLEICQILLIIIKRLIIIFPQDNS